MRIYRVMGGWAFVYEIRDDAGERIRVLRIGGVYQSATYVGERRFQLPFEYFRAFDRMFDARLADESTFGLPEYGGALGSSGDTGALSLDEPADTLGAVDSGVSAKPAGGLDVKRVLMIGGGGCTYPKHLVHSHPGLAVDVVERDPAIVRIARRHFYVEEAEQTGRMRLIVDDGLAFMKSSESVYDVMVNDAFNGAYPVGDLLRPNALELQKEHLSKDGVYMVNVVCSDSLEGAVHLREVLDALKRSFAHVSAVPAVDEQFGGKDNYIAIGSDARYRFAGAIEI